MEPLTIKKYFFEVEDTLACPAKLGNVNRHKKNGIKYKKVSKCTLVPSNLLENFQEYLHS